MSRDAIHRIIARACQDKPFRELLKANPAEALRAEGIQLPDDVQVVVHEQPDDTIMLVLPNHDAADLLERRASLPRGRAANLPEGMDLVWQGSTLHIKGELSTETGPRFRDELLKAFADVDLNMADVSFMGSAGLSALLVGQKHLSDHHAVLRIINPSAPVVSVMDISGFSDMFEVLTVSDEDASTPTGLTGQKVFPQSQIRVTNIDTPLV